MGRGKGEEKSGRLVDRKGAWEKTFGGPNSFFPPPCPVACSNPPGPTKAHKTLRGLKRFFPPPCPRNHHLQRNLVNIGQKYQRHRKFHALYSGLGVSPCPGPTKAHKPVGGPKRFFPPPCPRHMFEPAWLHKKPTKLSGARKVFFKSAWLRGPWPVVMPRAHAHTHTNTCPPQPNLPTLIISYFSLNSPEVSFRISNKLK